MLSGTDPVHFRDERHTRPIRGAETLTTDVRTLQPGNGYRLPPEAYHDRDWFEREQRQLFRRTWNYVGQTRDLPEPGDYLTADVGGGPIAVIRGDDGKLRALPQHLQAPRREAS
jgi:Phenylpropionate dioxygenase and related ring-hydroxylating dioxygenases, large terminal subunit